MYPAMPLRQMGGRKGEREAGPLPAHICSHVPSPSPPVLKCSAPLLCIINKLPCFILETAAFSADTSFIHCV